jgi:hypothetical protein
MACTVVACSFLVAALPAQAKKAHKAKPKPRQVVVRGSLVKGKGYAVVLTTTNGGGTRKVLGKKGTFSFKLSATKARNASLTLIRPNGRYFGPIVLRHVKRQTFTHLSGATSINLGKLKLKSGYVIPGARIPKVGVITKASGASSSTLKGKPVGAGKLGFVKRPSKKVKTKNADFSAPAPPPAGNDTDTDSIPNSFDIDDDGDLKLDSVDRDAGGPGKIPYSAFTNLVAEINQSVNVNTGSATAADIDTLIKNNLWMNFQLIGYMLGLHGVASVNVDCGLLVYCKAGHGTALVHASNPPIAGEPADGSLFTDFDSDSDGYPNLVDISSTLQDKRPGSFGLGTVPSVARSQIVPGDTYSYLVKSTEGATSYSTTLPPYFLTTPAIKSITDTGGTHTISYPVAANGEGTQSNPIALTSDVVTITFWRPQRLTVPGAETGTYMDMGGLYYILFAGGNNFCNATETSLYTGMTPVSDGYYDMLRDNAVDAAPNAANTLSVTVDIGKCFDRRTQSDAQSRVGGLNLDIEARTFKGDNASQHLHVTLPPAGS